MVNITYNQERKYYRLPLNGQRENSKYNCLKKLNKIALGF